MHKIANIVALVEISMGINSKNHNKIEGYIELSSHGTRPNLKTKKVLIIYVFNNHPKNLLTTGQEVDIDFVLRREYTHNMKYTYPNKTFDNVDPLVITVWSIVELVVDSMIQKLSPKNKFTNYSGKHLINKDMFRILFGSS